MCMSYCFVRYDPDCPVGIIVESMRGRGYFVLVSVVVVCEYT